MKCHKFYKIGISFDIQQRHNSIQGGNPYPVEIVYANKHPEARKMELELHKKFQKKRMSREWFILSNNDLEVIKKMINEWSRLKRK